MAKSSLKSHALTSLDMPSELLPGVPRIVISGTERVNIENHNGIQGFSPREIRIASALGEISLTGENLRLAVLTGHELTAEGTILGMTVHREEKK